MKKSFIDIKSHSHSFLKSIIDRAKKLKEHRKNSEKQKEILTGKVLAMIFEKPSTRTRVSFELAMIELGGNAIVLDVQDTQLARGESPADTARVLGRYCDAFMLRTLEHSKLDIFLKYRIKF